MNSRHVYQYDERLVPGTVVFTSLGWTFVVVSVTIDDIWVMCSRRGVDVSVLSYNRQHIQNLALFVQVQLVLVPST